MNNYYYNGSGTLPAQGTTTGGYNYWMSGPSCPRTTIILLSVLDYLDRRDMEEEVV